MGAVVTSLLATSQRERDALHAAAPSPAWWDETLRGVVDGWLARAAEADGDTRSGGGGDGGVQSRIGGGGGGGDDEAAAAEALLAAYVQLASSVCEAAPGARLRNPLGPLEPAVAGAGMGGDDGGGSSAASGEEGAESSGDDRVAHEIVNGGGEGGDGGGGGGDATAAVAECAIGAAREPNCVHFWDLPVRLRVRLVKALIDWHVLLGDDCGRALAESDPDALRLGSEPVGVGGRGGTRYFYFPQFAKAGDAARLCVRVCLRGGGGDSLGVLRVAGALWCRYACDADGGGFRSVARNSGELLAFAAPLRRSKDAGERALLRALAPVIADIEVRTKV